MGYRSDVMYVIQGTREAMLAALVEARMDTQLAAALEECVLTDDGQYVSVAAEFRGVKWYDSYPDVQMHEALWDFFDEKHSESTDDDVLIEGKFIAVGEDDETTQKDFGDGSLSLYEVIEVSVSINVGDIRLFDPDNDMRKKTGEVK